MRNIYFTKTHIASSSAPFLPAAACFRDRARLMTYDGEKGDKGWTNFGNSYTSKQWWAEPRERDIPDTPMPYTGPGTSPVTPPVDRAAASWQQVSWETYEEAKAKEASMEEVDKFKGSLTLVDGEWQTKTHRDVKFDVEMLDWAIQATENWSMPSPRVKKHAVDAAASSKDE